MPGGTDPGNMSEERVPRRVGLVGPEGDALAAARETVERGGVTAVSGGAHAMAAESAVDAVVAVGERALVDLARSGLPGTVPVLPVGPVDGVGSLPTDAVERGVGSLLNGSFERHVHPVLAVMPPVGEARALFDLTLVSEEPARISEFTVRSGTETVARFRADGVVVATPAGSGDYARAAGGPVLGQGTGVVSVVPIAPFATDTDHWVLDDSSVVLRIERDDTPVELLADGRPEDRVDPGEALRVDYAGGLTVAAVSGRRNAFGR